MTWLRPAPWPFLFVSLLLVSAGAHGDEEESFDERHGVPPPDLLDAAELEVGLDMYSRSLRYTQTLASLFPARQLDAPPSYSLPAAPRGRLSIAAFPGANLTGQWLAHVGVDLESGFAVPTTARTEAEVYKQDHDFMKVGLLGRIPIDQWSFLARVGWGVHHFQFTPQGDVPSPVPDVAYSFLDLGMITVYRAGPLRFELALSYLLGNDAGEIAEPDWFPNASFQGVHVLTSAAYRISRHFGVRFSLRGTQFGLDFNPVSPDALPERVAGGATDRTIAASMGIVYHVPAAFK